MKIFTLKLRTLRFILKVLGSVRSTCKVLRLSQIKILGHSSTARRLVTLLCPSVCAHVTARLAVEGCPTILTWGGGLSQIKLLGHSSTARRLVTSSYPSVCAHVTARLAVQGVQEV